MSVPGMFAGGKPCGESKDQATQRFGRQDARGMERPHGDEQRGDNTARCRL